jgi:hypothetical protein
MADDQSGPAPDAELAPDDLDTISGGTADTFMKTAPTMGETPDTTDSFWKLSQPEH